MYFRQGHLMTGMRRQDWPDWELTRRFAQYTAGMAKVNAAKVKTKAEADKILQEVEPVRLISHYFEQGSGCRLRQIVV